MSAGRITNLYRYPVKSFQGETLDTVTLGEKGIPGDRAWAVRDEVRGGIQGGKKIPQLMELAARYLEEPGDGQAPAAEISLPSGDRFLSSDEDAAARLSKAAEREVTIWPLLPADALDHYKRAAPDDPDMLKELRAVFGRTEDEPLPDIGKFPPEILQYESPPGTYFDAFPLLVMSERSMQTMDAAAPDSQFDVRRFRPNLVVAAEGDDDFPELAWVGKRVRMGEAVIEVAMECPRCVMTTHGFADLAKDPGIMRSLVKRAGGNLGVYASVAEPGAVRVGDTVEVLGG